MDRPLLSNHENFYNSYYWKFLFLIGMYYLLPSLQFVLFQANDNNVQCYYNFKCKHELSGIPSFNNFISNIFYVIYGLTFLIIVKLNNRHFNDGISNYGLYNHKSLYYSLGLVLCLEGICSSLYHICPSKLNFQFDTTFMFIGTTLMFITLYSKRHRYIISPIKTYFFLSLVVLLNMLPLSGVTDGIDIWFWVIIILFISYLMIFGSVYVYYGVEYDFDMQSLCKVIRNIKSMRTKHIPKILLLVCLNGFTIGMLIYALIAKPSFTTWMLNVFIINLTIYFLYYIIHKLKHSEPISKKIYFFFIVDVITLTLAIYFYTKYVTNITLSIEESNKLNRPCVLFTYFDYHDIWHILSATGLFIFMNIVFFLDKNLDNTLLPDIAVF